MSLVPSPAIQEDSTSLDTIKSMTSWQAFQRKCAMMLVWNLTYSHSPMRQCLPVLPQMRAMQDWILQLAVFVEEGFERSFFDIRVFNPYAYLPSIPAFLTLSPVSASPHGILELLQILPGFNVSHSVINPWPTRGEVCILHLLQC